MAEELRRALVGPLIEQALREDGVESDCTVAFLKLGNVPVRASILARRSGVMAGLDIAKWTFAAIDQELRFDAKIKDGDRVAADDVVAEIRGRASSVLAGERVALNFLQRLCGIATLSARFVDAVAGSGIRILDTRKTTPLFRMVERHATRMGGADNHRFNLSDMILIKENHIRAMGGVTRLADSLRTQRPTHKLEVEVDSLTLLNDLLGAPVQRIMLDNFSPDLVRAAIDRIRLFQKERPYFRPEIEISGGIDLDTIGDYIIDGVDYISIGAITHSAPALDLSLEVE